MVDMRPCGWLPLVETIERVVGYPLSPAVRHAFLTVDRRHFVPRYFVQQGPRWVERDAGPEVYENRAFLTHLDRRGVPNSSSSQPSLMAPMLEALAVQPGHRVLEVGTGTGYNAALLGELVGNQGRVVSVDIDATLVEGAARRLAERPWMEAVVADGLLGYSSEAPYDRIMTTAGAAHIPSAWVEQLTEDGILVGSLALPLSTATPLYRLKKDRDGGVHGSFLPTPAFFMPLSHVQSQPRIPPPDWAIYEALPVREQAWTQLDLPCLLKDGSFALFLDHHFPGLEFHLRPVGSGSPAQARTLHPCLLLPGRALLTFMKSADPSLRFAVEVRGEPVWSHLLELYALWNHLEQPALDRYRLTVDRMGALTCTLS